MLELLPVHPAGAAPAMPIGAAPAKTVESLALQMDPQGRPVVTATAVVDGTRVAIDVPVDGTAGALDISALARGMRDRAGLEVS